MRRALVLSLCLHLLFAVSFATKNPSFQASDSDSPQDLPQSLQTRTLSKDEFAKEFPSPKTKALQIVQSDDKLKSPVAPNPKQENYLGRHNQNFDQNTRAAHVGKFNNVLKEGLKDARKLFEITNNLNSANSESSPENSESKIPPGEVHHFAINKSAPKTPALKGRSPASILNADPVDLSTSDSQKGDGFSATDDYLPHIAIGANTLLNTREYKYASFYERIREKLNHQWKTFVRSEMESLYLQGVHQIEGERITKLRIELDPQGHVSKIVKYGSAGYQELDRAAVHAFEVAGPFSNPPKELLEGSEPRVSIDWHFVVVGGSQTGINMRVQRYPAGL